MNIKSVTNVLTATAISYVIVFALLFAADALSLGMDDPEKHLAILAYAIFYIGAAAGGFICAKLFAARTGEISGVVSGTLAGLAYIGVIFLISLLFYGEKSFLVRLAINTSAVAVSALGGFLAKVKTPKAKKVSPKKSRDSIRKKYLEK